MMIISDVVDSNGDPLVYDIINQSWCSPFSMQWKYGLSAIVDGGVMNKYWVHLEGYGYIPTSVEADTVEVTRPERLLQFYRYIDGTSDRELVASFADWLFFIKEEDDD